MPPRETSTHSDPRAWPGATIYHRCRLLATTLRYSNAFYRVTHPCDHGAVWGPCILAWASEVAHRWNISRIHPPTPPIPENTLVAAMEARRRAVLDQLLLSTRQRSATVGTQVMRRPSRTTLEAKFAAREFEKQRHCQQGQQQMQCHHPGINQRQHQPLAGRISVSSADDVGWVPDVAAITGGSEISLEQFRMLRPSTQLLLSEMRTLNLEFSGYKLAKQLAPQYLRHSWPKMNFTGGERGPYVSSMVGGFPHKPHHKSSFSIGCCLLEPHMLAKGLMSGTFCHGRHVWYRLFIYVLFLVPAACMMICRA